MKNRFRQQVRGVTLTELLVSIGITVAMLLMTSLVFKSSTDASGRAMARGEIMHQLRSITRQLDQDFKGLRSDMPLAIIFEEDAGEPVLVRQDRIWFFANGDYQANDFGGGSVSGNVAHVFYGQSFDGFAAPSDESSQLDRRILTRREKILTADTGIQWYASTPAGYDGDSLAGVNEAGNVDFMPVDRFGGFSTLAFWKNIPFLSYQNNFFLDNETISDSVIRRSAMVVDNPINNNAGLKFHPFGEEGFQRLYVAGDVTDFKVEVWFAGAVEWFPNATDWKDIDSTPLALPGIDTGYAFYWNAAENPTLIPPKYEFDNGIKWRGEMGINEIANNVTGWTNVWPEALRFSFTLYDKNRRHFPDGETFSYIVKMAKR